MPIVSASPPKVQAVVVNLTAAQIATLNSSPVTLLAAQGANTVIVPVAAAVQYKPGTVAFAATTSLAVRVGTADLGTIANLALNALVSKVTLSALDGGPVVAANTAMTLRANADPGYIGPILTSSLNAAGSLWRPSDTATVDDGTSGLITVSTVANSFPITTVNQGAKTFTVTGNASAFAHDDNLTVYRSTANNGTYTIDTAVFGGGSTVITVVEAIPSATANGAAGDPQVADVGSIATYALTTPGTGYSVASHGLTAVAPSVGTGASISVLTITNASNGTARVEVLYTVMALA